jgi:tetratricopeptide (TPR) repeat protein
MHKGGKALAIGASFAIVGCAGTGSSLQVRAVDPAAKLHQGNDELAAAQGLLALGSVGLALEGFRDAQRRQPADSRPLAGIAACYAAMGRYDIAEHNYQAALAIAPNDPVLLRSLAGVFDAEGKGLQAAEARRQAATPAASAATMIEAISPPPAIPQRLAASITVELPPARPAEQLASGEVENATVSIDADAPPAVRPASTITVPLPPARPATAEAHLTVQSLLRAESAAPRLIRLSRGEVALVTTSEPLWQARLASRTHASTAVRWVPLQSASARPNIQILNAARREGLAARARSMLLDRGWRRIAIGDAPAIRDESVVLYSAGHGMLGKSLAAQFGFRAVLSPEADVLLVLVGRDAALKATPRAG